MKKVFLIDRLHVAIPLLFSDQNSPDYFKINLIEVSHVISIFLMDFLRKGSFFNKRPTLFSCMLEFIFRRGWRTIFQRKLTVDFHSLTDCCSISITKKVLTSTIKDISTVSLALHDLQRNISSFSTDPIFS